MVCIDATDPAITGLAGLAPVPAPRIRKHAFSAIVGKRLFRLCLAGHASPVRSLSLPASTYLFFLVFYAILLTMTVKFKFIKASLFKGARLRPQLCLQLSQVTMPGLSPQGQDSMCVQSRAVCRADLRNPHAPVRQAVRFSAGLRPTSLWNALLSNQTVWTRGAHLPACVWQAAEVWPAYLRGKNPGVHDSAALHKILIKPFFFFFEFGVTFAIDRLRVTRADATHVWKLALMIWFATAGQRMSWLLSHAA
jgi:hypothetical protein